MITVRNKFNAKLSSVSYVKKKKNAVTLHLTIVTRNGKIVWKHGPKRSFYALILRIKNLLFSAMHQNTNKPKIRAVGLLMDLLF